MADKTHGPDSSDSQGGTPPNPGLTPLHLGLTPWNFHDMSAASLCDQAQFAEALGYQSIWVPENHFGPHAIPDPLMLLASMAGATQKIRLGTTSYLLTLRNPLQAAEQVAVLDEALSFSQHQPTGLSQRQLQALSDTLTEKVVQMPTNYTAPQEDLHEVGEQR